jgi:hypothetical protein
MAFGLSFLPTLGAGQDRQQGDRPAVEPIQQAIKVLTLRLPRVLGGGAFAPAPLLQGGGSMGNPFAGTGPMQGRPIAPMPSPSPYAPSPSPSSPYVPSGGGGSPISPGNPFNASQMADPMSRAILALAGGGFNPPSALPTPEPPSYRYQPPQEYAPPPPTPLPGPIFRPGQTAPAPEDESQPEPAPDLARDLADWLYRSERGDMRRV